MELGMVGLGKMGANMARRLRRGGIEVAAFNRHAGVTDELVAEVGITATYSLEQLVDTLTTPIITTTTSSTTTLQVLECNDTFI